MNFAELPASFLVGLTTLVGLCVGSFLNVVIYRTPKIMSLSQVDAPISLSYPASHCPACKTPLRALHLLPVASWLLLRGQCANCSTKISARYPCVELANGAMWFACAMHFDGIGSAVVWGVFCSTLLALSMIDWDTNLLPDSLTLPLLWVGLMVSTFGLTNLSTTEAIQGAGVGYAFLWVVSQGFELATGKVGMGGGDLKLLAAIGAWFGPMGCLWTVLLASVIGALVGSYLKSKQQLRKENYLPFGPFLGGAAVVFLFTYQFEISL
jgi:leader peptidase (prepilin peptidase)/N-methyltransferase